MNQIQNQLRKFNLMCYADLSVKYGSNDKGGEIITRTDGEWKYEDEFYGGEPYCGNETIWKDDKSVFRCVYWGKVESDVDLSTIYNFLRRALKEGPTGNCVHRGPEEYTEGEFKYTNSCTGNIEEFVQTEKIFLKGKEVYLAHLVGGLVSVRS